MTGAANTREDEVLSDIPTQLYIGGVWRDAASGATFDVEDPATGKRLVRVADAGEEDAMAALDAASAAQHDWARTPPRERAEILRRAFEAVVAHTEELALIMTLEMGKPLAEARGEVAYGAEFLRWFSEEAPRVSGRYTTSPDGGSRLLITKQPAGPSLLITPWNFPLAMVTRKVGPAIAAGCTMVLKPAELTPLTALYTARLLEEAGLPAGVLNVIPTSRPSPVTGPLLEDPRLRKLSFTGSTQVGARLIAASANRVLKVSMELGGNAPLLVFDDADLDAAVAGAAIAKLRNGGESCVAANRFLVHESVAHEFTERFIGRLREVKVGRGTETGVGLGPLADAKSRDKVDRLVAGARAAGATVALGGRAVPGAGYFYEPTVLTDVPPGAEILKEEIFGPVAPIVTFRSEAEAIRLANASDFGLTAFAFTRDLNRALRLGEELETGMLGINTGVVSNPAAPFGGAKMSGLGREGGSEGIDEYLETRYVGIADPYQQ